MVYGRSRKKPKGVRRDSTASEGDARDEVGTNSRFGNSLRLDKTPSRSKIPEIPAKQAHCYRI
jgi:hypothetical protein